MSISSSEIYFASGSSSCSSGKSQEHSWQAELRGRIHLYPGEFTDFLDNLVPSSTPFPLTNAQVDTAFDKFDPAAGKEVTSYPDIIAGLETLVKNFDEGSKPIFYNTSKRHLKFPFVQFAEQHARSSPDISASFPGDSKTPLEDLTWHALSLTIEAKATREQDPFPRESNAEHDKTIVQIARNARNLLLAHGFLYSFVIGIYGDVFRVARFDHAGAVVSHPVSLKEPGGPMLLQRFLWRFTHPAVGATVVGCDPTVQRLTEADQGWVRRTLQAVYGTHFHKCPGYIADVARIDEGRRVEVPCSDGGSKAFIAFRLLDINGRLFSRATGVWRILEDTRILNADGILVDNPSDAQNPDNAEKPKIRIMKEAWRQLVRTPEARFYERLAAAIEEGERIGLARLVAGGDLGEREVRQWTQNPVNAAKIEKQLNLRLSATSESASISQEEQMSQEASTSSTPAYSLPYPQHQTFSWTHCAKSGDHTYRERSHMRCVVDLVGRPITTFRSTRELIKGLRDAVQGHKLAWEKAGILHRDVSVGNILIVDDTATEKISFSGFLHDFDYSSMDPKPKGTSEVDDAPEPLASTEQHDVSDGVGSTDESAARGQDDTRKERTGTYYFMACEILSGRVIHGVHHDLESVYWVLLWTLLRHGEYVNPASKLEDHKSIFFFGDDTQSKNNKAMWLIVGSQGLRFPKCAPLTKLMLDFSDLVLRSVGMGRRCLPIPMSHDEVLELFDEALAMEGWPDNDCSLPCKWLDDKTSRGALPGLVSDFHELDSAIAPADNDVRPKRSTKRQNDAAAMPPPSETRSGTLRSAQKRSSTTVEESDEPEAGPSKSNTRSSSKRSKTASTSGSHSTGSQGSKRGSRRGGRGSSRRGSGSARSRGS